MNIRKIKVGRWYQTTIGIGQAVSVGGTTPPSVDVRITKPTKLSHARPGVKLLLPIDILHEIDPDTGKPINLHDLTPEQRKELGF